MGHRIDLTGKRFGRLVALTDAGSFDKGRKWNCVCDCGNSALAYTHSLSCGRKQSCGCLKRDKAKLLNRLRPYESLYNVVKRSSKYSNREFSLSYEDFLNFVNEKECHYCGNSIEWTEFGLKSCGTGHNLDRKDSSLGYSKENCVVCCWTCNRMKCNLGYSEFIAIVKRISERN